MRTKLAAAALVCAALLVPAWQAGHRLDPAAAVSYDSTQVHLAEVIYAGRHDKEFGSAAALRRLTGVRILPGTTVALYTGGVLQLCYIVRDAPTHRTYLVAGLTLARSTGTCPDWHYAGTLAGPGTAS